MRSGNPVYYWDSDVMISYLQNGKYRQPGEMEGLNQVANRINSKKASLIMSVLTRVEILEVKLENATKEDFLGFLKRDNIEEEIIDHHVCNIAHEIRDYYLRTRNDGFTVSTADAIHLGTAIHYGVDEFHTFDANPRKKPKHLGLLPLGSKVANYTLKICKPSVPQIDMFKGKALGKYPKQK